MRWKKVQGKGDVQDRRGGGGGMMGGGGLPIPGGKAGGGLGLIVLVVLSLLLGTNVVGGGGGGADSGLTPGGFDSAPAGTSTIPEENTTFEFTKFVSKDAQDFWQTQFQSTDRTYQRAPVVIFTSGTQSGCGPASSATGPFYCPADHKVYLDLSFFNELSRRFGAPGDFAAAYVIAHELAHHVQGELGIEAKMRDLQRENPDRANEYSVKLELQADCLAGVWAHSVNKRGNLDPGDIDEGLAAAAAVGDDRLGARSPEQWTHGSSELRVKWFRAGFKGGDSGACDTFSAEL